MDGQIDPELGAQSSSTTARRVRRLVELLLLAFVIHVFVVPQIGGARRALTVVGSVDPAYLVGAFILESLAFAAYARLTQLLLPEEVRPTFPIAFGTVMASTGINHVVPGGAATTAGVAYRLLGKAGVPPDRLGFAIGLQAVGSAVVLNALLWIALLISIPTSGFHPIYATAAAFGAVLIGLSASAVVAIVRHRDRFADRVARLLGRLPGLDYDRVHRLMITAATELELLGADRALLRTVIGLAAANWLLDAAALWLMLSAFGHRPGVVGLMVAFGLANVMAALPISPGGLGVVEAILIPTLVGFGTPRAEASIGVIAYRLLNFWLPIPVGALCYVAVEHATGTVKSRGFRGEVEAQLDSAGVAHARGDAVDGEQEGST